MTIGDAVASAVRQLRNAGIDGAARDARLLMAAALGIAPDRLTLATREPLPAPAAVRLERFVADRALHRPVAQIIGRRVFWGREFVVTSAVLDPRPETETLVALALDGPPPAQVLDLGTGSGAILVTLLAERPEARGFGIDIDAAALAVAVTNAERHGVEHRAAFACGHWFEPAQRLFDLVVSNPPYLSDSELEKVSPDVRDWEPRGALVSGPTGLECYRVIASGLAPALAPGGRGLFEIGAEQGSDVAAIFRSEGWANVTVHPDLDGRDRVVDVRG